MIYNSTYNEIEKEIETNNLVGKKFNLIKSIRLGGIGSKRLIVELSMEALSLVLFTIFPQGSTKREYQQY